jgi:hypothetical protein
MSNVGHNHSPQQNVVVPILEPSRAERWHKAMTDSNMRTALKVTSWESAIQTQTNFW